MKNIIYFFILVLFLLIIGFVGSIILDNEAKLIQYLNENYTTSQVNMYFETKQKWQWFSYSIIPIFLLIKISIIASILYIGTFFYSKAKVTFKQLFNAVVKAEFVFLGVGVLKIVWFYFFQTSYTLEDLQYFYPLSALNIVGYKGLEAWFIYPLQVLNLFELAYWLLLAYFIGKLAFT